MYCQRCCAYPDRIGVHMQSPGSVHTHSQKRIMKHFPFTKPHDFRVFTTQGVTPSINRQGGQHSKKIITPKKYLRFAKNTDCGEMHLMCLAAHCKYMKKPTYI